MTRIKKGSSQYKQNLDRQKFLKDNGVNVKLDGSWGPWQQKWYDKIINQNKQNWFTKATIGAAVAENPAVMTASGWKQDRSGNWIQKPTKETDQLADNLEVLSWSSPTHPGTAFIEKVIVPSTAYIGKEIGNKALDYTFNNGFNLSYILNKNKTIDLNNLTKIGQGSESTIYDYGNRVLKVSNNSFSKNNANLYSKSRVLRNRGPYYLKERVEGIIPTSDNTYKVVTSQKKIGKTQEAYDPKFLEDKMIKAGYRKVQVNEIPYLPGVQNYNIQGAPVYSQYSFLDPRRGISVWTNGKNYITDVRLGVNTHVVKTPFGNRIVNIDNDAVLLSGKYKGLYPLGDPRFNSTISARLPNSSKISEDIINYITKYSKFK